VGEELPTKVGRSMLDVWGADWWDAWQAFGTVGAVAIAMLLALYEGVRARRAEKALTSEREQRLQSDRFATAALVSAWVETQYEPAADGTHYLRRGTLYLANESNEPVFNVHVVVGVGQPVVQIGPLAVPAPLPVVSELRALGHELANYGMAAHAWYPAPQVAYVRLVHEGDQDNVPSVAGYVEVRAQIITLVFYAGAGWRVFSAGAGATEPDWIEFPPAL
jgi:hypothetical protein